jgi:hypothetical protein
MDLIPDDGPAAEMMTDEERAALAALPARVRLYRGADRGINERGLCWSLERATAQRFPFYLRYRAADPVLVTATIRKTCIVALKFGRGEREVIARPARVRVISVRSIPTPKGVNIAEWAQEDNTHSK